MNLIETIGSFSSALLSGDIEVVDLSSTLGPDTPLLELPAGLGSNTPKIEIHKISEYDEDGKDWAWNWLKLGEHSGTHFDTPHHWISGRGYEDGYTDTIPPQNFVAPVNVIDCSNAVKNDSAFLLTAEMVQTWEREHGAILPGEWVLMRTDWDKVNVRQSGNSESGHGNGDSPGPTTDCIEYLLSRGVTGWGTQTLGADAGCAHTFTPPYPAHYLMQGANRYGLASLCNLDKLPAKGAILIAAPLKIERGTGSPIRALALVPKI